MTPTPSALVLAHAYRSRARGLVHGARVAEDLGHHDRAAEMRAEAVRAERRAIEIEAQSERGT